MASIDLDVLSDELESPGGLKVMSALIRSSLYHGADNRPALVILTDEVMYLGGSESTGGMFQRIPLKSIVASSRVGVSIWECVEVRHIDIEGEKTIYICPFTGSPAAPRKDSESMDVLLTHISRR